MVNIQNSTNAAAGGSERIPPPMAASMPAMPAAATPPGALAPVAPQQFPPVPTPAVSIEDIVGGNGHVRSADLAEYTKQKMRILVCKDKANRNIKTFVYEDGCYQEISKNDIEAQMKEYVKAAGTTDFRIASLDEAYRHLTMTQDIVLNEDLNADEAIINFRNCLVRITPEAISVEPHTPEILSTIQIPCDWTDDPPPSPVFDAFLDSLSNHDEEVAHLLLQVVGVVISNIPGYRTKKSLFLYGPGNTGKSQFFNLLKALLGDKYVAVIDLETLEKRFSSSLAYNKRLVGCPDIRVSVVSSLANFKSMTGGDPIFAEKKYEPAFFFIFKGFAVYAGNALPQFKGDHGDWVYSRMMPVHCKNVIPEEEQDHTLLQKMITEFEGIAHKAVLAAQEVLADDYRFREPDSVIKTRAAYKKDNNPVEAFFKGCMTACGAEDASRAPYTTGTIARIYNAWCRDTYGVKGSAQELRNGLCSMLNCTYQQMTTHNNRGTIYRDYTIKKSVEDEYHKLLAH